MEVTITYREHESDRSAQVHGRTLIEAIDLLLHTKGVAEVLKIEFNFVS